MPEKIYVVGHKSPDLDSVAGAISYAELKNKLESTDRYVPSIVEDINKETKYVLEKFGFEVPGILKSAKNKSVILVDHNEASQTVDGMDEANIVAVLDHHKIDFSYGTPIEFIVRPWGSSNSLIAAEFAKNNIEIEKNLAGIMLSAVLVDTVITKSPTCTEKDKEIIEELAKKAGIDDWKEFGMEIFKVRSSVGDLSDEEIVKYDYKDFNFKSGKFGIGQIETVDLSELESREDDLLTSMDKIREEGGYHSVILFITDIIKEGSKFLVSTSDQKGFEKAFDTKLENNRVYIDGIISRKKQIIPNLSEVFDK